MLRIERLSATVTLCLSVTTQACSVTSEEDFQARVDRIHAEAIVIDAHAHPKSHASTQIRLGEKTGEIEVEFPTLAEGGVDAVFFAVPLPGMPTTESSRMAQILADIDSIRQEVGRNAQLAEMATSPHDLRRIHESGKRAVLLGLEDGDPLGGDLGALPRLYDAGIRMITWSPVPDPGPEQGDRGGRGTSDEFERQAIIEMNRLGIIIDISHMTDSQQMAVIRRSSCPVVASHSCARALNDVPRQMPDSVIQALAQKGGVIGVTFFPGHISEDFPSREVSVEDLVDHIDHIVQVAGVDHVGFGSDFLGSEAHTRGLESAAGLPSITRELLLRGYSGTEVQKFLGGNLLRVFETVSETSCYESGAEDPPASYLHDVRTGSSFAQMPTSPGE